MSGCPQKGKYSTKCVVVDTPRPALQYIHKEGTFLTAIPALHLLTWWNDVMLKVPGEDKPIFVIYEHVSPVY